MISKPFLVVLGSLLATDIAHSTDDDWSSAQNVAAQTTVASVNTNSGLTLQVICHAGSLVVGMRGSPSLDGDYVRFQRHRPDGDISVSLWTNEAGRRVLRSADPVRMARSFKTDPELDLRLSNDGQPDVRISVPLPRQSSNLDAVLSACDYPLMDDRDQLASADEFLERFPAIAPPRSPRPQHDNVQVDLSCIVREARLRECRADRTYPRDDGFGAAAAREADGTWLRLTDAEGAEGGRVDVVVTGARIRR